MIYLAQYQVGILLGRPESKRNARVRGIDFQYSEWRCGCSAYQTLPDRYVVLPCNEDAGALEQIAEGDELLHYEQITGRALSSAASGGLPRRRKFH